MTDPSKQNILIPISPGELLDKITILEIKSERIDSAEKKSHVNNELALLNTVWYDSVAEDAELKLLREELKSINESLWVIEDDIRDCLLYTSPSPRDKRQSRMPSSA